MLIRKGGSTQRGFSCLSGAGHCHNGIICGELQQPVCEFSGNHGIYDSGYCIDGQPKLQFMPTVRFLMHLHCNFSISSGEMILSRQAEPSCTMRSLPAASVTSCLPHQPLAFNSGVRFFLNVSCVSPWPGRYLPRCGYPARYPAGRLWPP